jgi:hypothetical protein
MSFDYIAIAGEGLVGIKEMKTNRFTEAILSQNTPNPFTGTTSVVFSLPEAGRVLLDVYDINGKQMAQLVNGTKTAGAHTTIFDAKNLPGGVYFLRLTFSTTTTVKKIIINK